MGIYAHILKNWEKHNPQKVFMDTAAVCFTIDAKLYYHNDKTFFKDGNFRHVSMNVIDDTCDLNRNSDTQFIFNIQGVNEEDLAVGLDKDFDYLVHGQKLCSLAYIENVRENNTELIFRFAYEYLKLNPDEYIWFEWDYVFSFNEMKKLKELPFDKNWCFTKPL